MCTHQISHLTLFAILVEVSTTFIPFSNTFSNHFAHCNPFLNGFFNCQILESNKKCVRNFDDKMKLTYTFLNLIITSGDTRHLA